MARSKDLKVNIVGDSAKLDRELRRSGNALDKFGKQTRLTGTVTSKGFAAMRVGAIGATAAVGGLAVIGKKVVDAASDIDESLSKNRVLFGKYAKDIDKFSKDTAKSLGISRASALEATGTFGNLFTALEIGPKASADMSTSLVKLAADMASFNNASPEETLDAIRSGLVGETEPLRRFGVNLNDATLRAEALRMGLVKTTKDALEPQTRALAVNSLLFKQTEKAQGDFARTSDGAANQQRILNAQFQDAQAKLGGLLLPTFTKGIRTVNKFVGEMQDGTGSGGEFVDTMRGIWTEVKPVVTWIGRATKNVAEFVREHPNVGRLALAILGVGAAVKTLKFVSAATGFTELLKAGRAASSALRRTFAAAGTAAGEEAAANAATGLSAKSGALRGAGRTAGRAAGKGLVVGVVAGTALLLPEIKKSLEKVKFKKINLADLLFQPLSPLGLAEKGASAIRGLLGKIGDGIGKGGGGSGKGASSLMGANSALKPLAAVGSKFGLRVSSGMRPGSITSSGNMSYHGSGEAIDLAGPPSAMLRTFRALKASVGGRLAELIYTPGGTGIKDGRPHRYSGRVAAEHNDHVHVALDLGRAGAGIGDGDGYGYGIGDGYGKSRIQNLWTKAGGSPAVSNLAAAVALAESGGNPSAKNVNSNGSIDRGLWQINSIHGALSTFDPMGNARSAVKISSGGKNWRPWVAYTTGAYRRFLSGGSSSSSGGRSSAPSATDRREASARAGSRLVNRIASSTLRGASRDIRAQRSIGQVIEDAEGGYGRSERFFGQVRGGRPGDFGEEDLGTAQGRADRISELQELKKLKANQLARMRKRAAALKRLIAKYEKALKRMHRARSKSRGAKRAKISERMKAYDDRLVDYKAELRGLGESIADTQLDIGDLTKDIQEVAATPDTEGPTASDKLSQALGDIDLQERAGLLTPEQAQAARIGTLNAALAGGFGALGQREIWDVMGQLREVTAAQVEAQKAATEAALAQTQALRDLKASIDAQVAFGDRVSAITSMEAVRAMADVMSRQLGTNVAARQSLPGSGQLSRL